VELAPVKSDRATPIREVSIAICFDPGRPPDGGPNIAAALAKLHTLSAHELVLLSLLRADDLKGLPLVLVGNVAHATARTPG